MKKRLLKISKRFKINNFYQKFTSNFGLSSIPPKRSSSKLWLAGVAGLLEWGAGAHPLLIAPF